MELYVSGKRIDTAPILHLLRQGENNADTLVFLLPRRYSGHDLSHLRFLIYGANREKGTVAVQDLSGQVRGDSLNLTWRVSRDFTAVSGLLELTVVGISQDSSEVIKFIGDPVEVWDDIEIGDDPPGLSLFEQVLLSMQEILVKAEAMKGQIIKAEADLENTGNSKLNSLVQTGEQLTDEINQAGNDALTNFQLAANQAREEAITAIEQAGDRQEDIVLSGAENQVKLIVETGTVQVKAVQTAGTAAADRLVTVGGEWSDTLQSTGTAQVAAVNTAGTRQTAAAKAQADNAAAAADRAENASLHPPYIGADGCFWVWKVEDGKFSSSGVVATGAAGKTAYQYAKEQGFTGTEAQFAALLSKLKDLSNVDNVRQYSGNNPPPYPVTSVSGRAGAVTLSKTDVGLSNVDNTSDINKPISTATQAALNAKANTASPTFTGTVTIPEANITGNVRIKGTGNYGNKINFGDGDYVSLSETADDVLEIKATTIKLCSSGGTEVIRINSGKAYCNNLELGVPRYQ